MTELNETALLGLRDRIVAVLYEDGQRPMAAAVRLADAVIAELGLRQEWSVGDDDGRVLYDDQKDAKSDGVRWGDELECRWITEWKPDK